MEELIKKILIENSNELFGNQIAEKYLQQINNPLAKLPLIRKDDVSAFHLFVVTGPDRGRFMQYMTENGVATAQHYPVPCHLQKAYSFLQYKKGDFPKSEYLAEHCVSLPMFAELTDNEVHKIINLVNNFK